MIKKANKILSQKEKQYLIMQGSIPKAIFKLSWPIMIGNTMQVLYNLADTFWVGKLGAESVAAISVGFPLVFLLISIGGGITLAGTTLVAQYTGANDRRSTNHVSGQILMFVTFLAIIFSIIGVIFNYKILQLMGAPAAIIEEASQYLNIIFGGVTFMFLFFVFSALLRGYGDTKTPMRMMVASTLLNIVIDPFLIFGWLFFPRLGVAGAAYATVFSRAIVGFLGIYMLFKGNKGISLIKSDLIPDWNLLKKIIKIGVPAAAEQTIIAFGMTILMGIVSNFGAMAVAAYGIGSRILSVVMMPIQGVSMATTTMVGQNLGAQKVDRAEKSTWISSIVIMGLLTLLGLIVVFVPAPIITVFNNNNEVVKYGVEFLRIVGLSFGFLGVRIVIGGSFRGAGNTIAAMILASIALWGLRLPLAQYFSVNLDWGTSGIWWGMFISNLVSAIIGVLWFKRGTWKDNVIG